MSRCKKWCLPIFSCSCSHCVVSSRLCVSVLLCLCVTLEEDLKTIRPFIISDLFYIGVCNNKYIWAPAFGNPQQCSCWCRWLKAPCGVVCVFSWYIILGRIYTKHFSKRAVTTCTYLFTQKWNCFCWTSISYSSPMCCLLHSVPLPSSTPPCTTQPHSFMSNYGN